jgi:hypothetical protein
VDFTPLFKPKTAAVIGVSFADARILLAPQG